MVALAILLLAAADVQAPPVVVQGSSLCPTPDEVAAILPDLLPCAHDQEPDIATIETREQDLFITLRDPRGNALVARHLSSGGNCADLANAAAVVIAAWKAERNPGLSLFQPGVPSPAPESGRPAHAAIPEAAADPQKTKAQPTEKPTNLHIEVAAALGTSVNGAGWAGSGHFEVGLHRRALGLRMILAADSERQTALESGRAAWRRLTAGVGPTLLIVEHSVAIEVNAQLLMGNTIVHGQGFDSNKTSHDIYPGFAAGVRLGRGRGLIRPWMETGGQIWPAPEDLAVTKEGQATARTQLPRVELRLLAGLSVAIGI
jgi:hypothetical protein